MTLAVVMVGIAAGIALAERDRSSTLGIVQVASGFTRPVFVSALRSEPGRLYVVEQPGVIRVLIRGKRRVEPFLDIRSLVDSDGNEQGLLGLAFDPGYAKNHRFSGIVWSLTVDGGNVSAPRREPFPVSNLSSFGERPRRRAVPGLAGRRHLQVARLGSASPDARGLTERGVRQRVQRLLERAELLRDQD